jgi:glutaredoxin
MEELYVIFGRNGCPYTENAKKHAKEYNLNHVYYHVSGAKSNDIPEQFKKLIQSNKHSTVPCVFKLSFVGGFSDFSDHLNSSKSESNYSGSEHSGSEYSESEYSSNSEYSESEKSGKLSDSEGYISPSSEYSSRSSSDDEYY